MKKPNPWRLFDTLGNVSEWCHGFMGSKIPPGEYVDPLGTTTWDTPQIARGNSYCENAAGIRDRTYYSYRSTSSTTGFRMMRTIPDAPAFAAVAKD